MNDINQMTYGGHEVAPNIGEICKIADDLQSGCFICVHRYHASNGEIADYWLNYGRDYVRIKANFIEKLKGILWKNEPFGIEVDYTTWVDDKKVEHSHDAKASKVKDGEPKGRTKVHVVQILDATDPDLRQVLREMLRTYAVRHMMRVRSGTIQRFERKAKGIYLDRDGKIHFRMSTLVWKKVIQPATVEHYSIRKSAIAQAVRDKFLKLKAFKLGQFESMSIGGRQLLWGAVANRVPFDELVQGETVNALKGGEDEGR
jgi:hypothetical protein